MYASMCVLPGMDPRKIRDKECQDNCIYISRLDVFFAALFDGHGENGGILLNRELKQLSIIFMILRL